MGCSSVTDAAEIIQSEHMRSASHSSLCPLALHFEVKGFEVKAGPACLYVWIKSTPGFSALFTYLSMGNYLLGIDSYPNLKHSTFRLRTSIH